jgi:D-alanine-D-alanine ligase
MASAARRIALVFGSRSVEHGVSIVTARAVWLALRAAEFTPLPLYIAEDGRWWLGRDFLDTTPYGLELFSDAGRYARAFAAQASEVTLLPRPSAGGPKLTALSGERPVETPFDALLLATHGSNGEDGSLQGLCELAGVPYSGSDVAASAAGMDKSLMKKVFAASGFRQVRSLGFTRRRWEEDSATVLSDVETNLRYPLFVKPNALGSSKGVSPAPDEDQLFLALGIAAEVDERIVVEEAVEGATEINVAVLGEGEETIASLCEQPRGGDWQDYGRKYLAGGNKLTGASADASRRVPAEISDALADECRAQARRAFAALGCAGAARVDFLIAPDETVYLNEINTIPGALSLELWRQSGISPAELVTRLVELALARHAERARSSRSMAAL